MADMVSKAAAALGRLGGLKGGKARAKALSKRRRAAIARLGAQATNKAKRAKKRAAAKAARAAGG